jgi:pre-mRNA-processing factor 6
MSGVGPKTAPTYNIPAPSNYVAGIGRGAMGFTTRSDIGPARAAPTVDFGAPPAGYVAGRGRGMGDLAKSLGEVNAPPAETDHADYSESNYDEFSGYGERLFTAGAYEEDDVEADQIYGAVDEQMDSRRKRSREKQLLAEQKKAKFERPRIADQFMDLKRELSNVTAEQWDAIPDAGDHSLKYKQSRKKDSFTPAPDTIIAGAAALRAGEMGRVANDDPIGTASVVGGSSSGMQSSLGGMHGAEMNSELTRLSASVTGQTSVDATGYLTSLNTLKVTSEAEIGDIKKARVLLQSVTSTNPKHAPGWIAAARVEEYANKMQQARKVILHGCEQCPESEDVWIEAARLHPTETAKAILANAVIHIPTSVKIWLKAADLETTDSRKKAVLRKALEFIPNSVQLWKAAIELENVTDARILLARAVECVPQSVDMWLALAKLETHENARKVLNQAREAIPTERATWITAAKLEEAHKNGHLVGKIIEKMVVSLAQYQVVIKRDEWIQEAVESEKSGGVLTCQAIIRNTIHLGVEAEDRKKTWMDDVEQCLSYQPPAVQTARAILTYALEIFPNKKSIWQQAAMVEKEYGTPESLEAKLKEGVQHCPQAEILWLMAAKEKWLAGNVPGARAILLEAFNANPKSEQIWLAAVKLEWENNEFQRARSLLTRARERAPSERVWLKSALLEREINEFTESLRLLDEGIKNYPSFTKFYMMAGQICDENLNDGPRAEKYYIQGLKASNGCLPLWSLLIRLKEKRSGLLKARSIGETARLKLPKNDFIWLECIRLERRSKDVRDHKLADGNLAKALQECPSSGLLWSELLLTCPKVQRKSKVLEAMKKCDQDPLVIMTIARLFEQSGRLRKAKKWYERSLSMNPRFGDIYVYYFAMEYLVAYKMLLLEEGYKGRDGNEKENGNEATEDVSHNMDGVDDEDDEMEEGEGGKGKSVNESKEVEKDSKVNYESESNLQQLINRCKENQPNQGEFWNSISKRTENRRKDIGAILLNAVEDYLKTPLKYFQYGAPVSQK